MVALTPPYRINQYRPGVESIREIQDGDSLYIIDLYMKINNLDQGQTNVPKNRLSRHDVGDYATLGSDSAVLTSIYLKIPS